MALLANVVHVGGKAIADIDHGVQFDERMELLRFANARREIEMFAAQAAAERAGDHKPVAGLRAGPPDRPSADGFA